MQVGFVTKNDTKKTLPNSPNCHAPQGHDPTKGGKKIKSAVFNPSIRLLCVPLSKTEIIVDFECTTLVTFSI